MRIKSRASKQPTSNVAKSESTYVPERRSNNKKSARKIGESVVAGVIICAVKCIQLFSPSDC
ncbi:MAG: hypothetical protein FWC89_04385 [Defluviitaleaceae bacterium]|nr:hypothetical protein [Defluviitaleaceae bacterium]